MSSSSRNVFKMSKAKIRRARFGKQGGGGGKKWEREPCLSPTPLAFFASLFTKRLHHYLGAWNRLIWSCLKTIYQFGCLKGTLVVLDVLVSFLVSYETVRLP